MIYQVIRGSLKYLLGKFYRISDPIFTGKGIDYQIEYQEKGLSLHREDFRASAWDWVELKLLATSHNMSMCAFFVLLLRLEIAGALEVGKGGVPPIFPKISLIQSITSYSIPEFRRILHLRL